MQTVSRRGLKAIQVIAKDLEWHLNPTLKKQNKTAFVWQDSTSIKHSFQILQENDFEKF